MTLELRGFMLDSDDCSHILFTSATSTRLDTVSQQCHHGGMMGDVAGDIFPWEVSWFIILLSAMLLQLYFVSIPWRKYCSCSLFFYYLVPSAGNSARCCFKCAIITILNCVILFLPEVFIASLPHRGTAKGECAEESTMEWGIGQMIYPGTCHTQCWKSSEKICFHSPYFCGKKLPSVL